MKRLEIDTSFRQSTFMEDKMESGNVWKSGVNHGLL